MKKMLTMMAAVGLTAGLAQAALLANWADPGVVTVTDNAGDEVNGGTTATDIISVKSVHQGGGYYFLLTLTAAPTPAANAPAYMINFDLAAGGASSSTSYYIAGGLVGIDAIVDGHYDPFVNGGLGGYVANHQHDFIGGSQPQFDLQNIGDVNVLFNTDASGAQLEWFVPDALLAQQGTINVFGSSLNAGPGGDTFDTTSALVINVPEPTSMALLALGIAAIGLRRKFRS